MDVLVIGAGVSGLTTGICLAEAGLSVTIRAAAPPGQTTSVAAGAVWGPVRVGPPDRVLGWGRTGLRSADGERPGNLSWLAPAALLDGSAHRRAAVRASRTARRLHRRPAL